MRLAIDIPDMNAPFFSGVQTLTVIPIGMARSSLRLDAGPGITVKAVRSGGRPATYTHEQSVLTVKLNTPVPAGRDVDVVIEYDCDLTNNHGRGLTWSPPNPKAKSPTAQAPQLHSQGEAQENSRWIPCHDFPNLKLTTELVVTVEDGFEVCSNGRLVSKKTAPSGRVTWDWLQDKPHPFYLVTLVVGKLAVVDINSPSTPGGSARPGLPMHVYTPIGTEENVKANFANTPAMIAYFEKKFDETYPWDKYDQLIVRDFNWGGMENTSATTLYMSASIGNPEMHTDLISHELAHQWFGDLVTCKSWEHVWLNEGWASIAEALWREQEANLKAAGISPTVEEPSEEHAQAGSDGTSPPDQATAPEEKKPKKKPAHRGFGSAAADLAPASEEGRRAYQRTILGFMQSQRAGNRTYAPLYPSMASRYYTRPDESIMKIDDVYAKGAAVLHMLRVGLGDETFTAGTRLYLDRLKFKSAETDEFRQCLEEVSGKSLERFFDQWVFRPGLPRLDIDLNYDGAALIVDVEQTQRLDADNPAYEFTLPLFLKFEDGSHRYEYIQVNQRKITASFNLDSKPTQVSVDPNLTVLSANNTRKPLAMWINELNDPPTLAAELLAAESLRLFDDNQACNALLHAAADPARDPVIREAAVAAGTFAFLRHRLLATLAAMHHSPDRFAALTDRN
jgi:aminopeptidase N